MGLQRLAVAPDRSELALSHRCSYREAFEQAAIVAERWKTLSSTPSIFRLSAVQKRQKRSEHEALAFSLSLVEERQRLLPSLTSGTWHAQKSAMSSSSTMPTVTLCSITCLGTVPAQVVHSPKPKVGQQSEEKQKTQGLSFP